MNKGKDFKNELAVNFLLAVCRPTASISLIEELF
jgi:hypothetical protein